MNALRSTLNALLMRGSAWRDPFRYDILRAITPGLPYGEARAEERGMPRRRIKKYSRSATRVLLMLSVIILAFILLMVFALGR